MEYFFDYEQVRTAYSNACEHSTTEEYKKVVERIREIFEEVRAKVGKQVIAVDVDGVLLSTDYIFILDPVALCEKGLQNPASAEQAKKLISEESVPVYLTQILRPGANELLHAIAEFHTLLIWTANYSDEDLNIEDHYRKTRLLVPEGTPIITLKETLARLRELEVPFYEPPGNKGRRGIHPLEYLRTVGGKIPSIFGADWLFDDQALNHSHFNRTMSEGRIKDSRKQIVQPFAHLQLDLDKEENAMIHVPAFNIRTVEALNRYWLDTGLLKSTEEFRRRILVQT